MASPSAYSPVDTDRFMAREQHVMLSQSSEPEAHEETGTETDFAGCGGQFAERKGSYPHQIDISEEEDSDRQPCSPYQAEPYLSPSPGRAGRPSLGSPPTTPTPTRGYQDAHLVQPSEVPFGRDIRWGRRRPRRSSGHRTAHSQDASSELPDSPVDNANENQDDEERNEQRGRSTTPVPYHPYAGYYTPSQQSVETEEDYGEGRAPTSPNPYSSYYTYNPGYVQAEIEGFDARVLPG